MTPEQEREKLRVEREATDPRKREARQIEVRGPKGNRIYVWADTGEPVRPFGDTDVSSAEMG